MSRFVRLRPRFRRPWLAGALIGALALGGLAAAIGPLLGVPNPITLAALAIVDPSSVGTWFSSRKVAAAASSRALPVRSAALPPRVSWKGRSVPLAEMLEATHTNALLVTQDGILIHEWYRPGAGPATLFPSWSVAKSVVSLLVGQTIAAGKLAETDPVATLLPYLRAEPAFGRITVRDLLDMTSGLAVPENYDPWDPLTGTAGLYLTRDIRAFVRDHATLSSKPGSTGQYRSIDTEILGLILAEVEKKPLADLLSERIWKPMGAQANATWNLDRPGGTEKAFCCLNAVARDFIRLGLMVADRGRVGGASIVPARWIERIETPARREVDGWPYSAQWWHVPEGDDDISAIGVYGQYVYINRDTGTVIVKLSDHGAEQDEADTLAVMLALSRALAASRPAR
ncbi:serine hydrolase domain-containing protein [Methylobacterium sp. E-045]|uniref:serine hydrolase domain-containing protein n=1 Tax=Methylobacterium sp. E-045 TaxID=2836575 RepID=UPI001FB9418C|nr:serine hydrolase [Methylobacterium sp. E-045]MCJ2130799.1 beta-lactamase family protein [Methylobacterium sp. E-045]